MIIKNGTLEVKYKTAGGIDSETGYAVQSSDETWGDPIDCQYSATSYNQLAQTNGEHYTRARYSILLEEQVFDEYILGGEDDETLAVTEDGQLVAVRTADGSDDAPVQVRLRGWKGEWLGDFSVIQVVPLQAVCQVQLIV